MVRPQALQDRLYRAKSWMDAAAALPPDQKHTEFVFLYIAFNALYGRRQYEGSLEESWKDREEFLTRVRKMSDYEKRFGNDSLRKALQLCQAECGELILNHFLRDSYWKRKKTARELAREFTCIKCKAEAEFGKGRYHLQLDSVLRRLGVLRNQILHGCVTYGTRSKGLPSLHSGLPVLRQLVPAFYALMDKYGHHVAWPSIPYPRVGTEAHPEVDNLQ
jgi:hypothetical protein